MNANDTLGLSLANMGLTPAAEAIASANDEEHTADAAFMEEDYAEEGDELEEEWSEEDDQPTQYDLRQYGVYQSLPIPSGPPDLQSDCTTAEEYIKRVRFEAQQLPQTVTSTIDPREFDAQRTDYVPAQGQDAVTAADCIPSHQWLTEFLADFANLRGQLHREEEDFDPFVPQPPPPPPPHPLPHSRDKNGWQRYCLGPPMQQPQQQQQAGDEGTAGAFTQSQQTGSMQQSSHNHQHLLQDQHMTEALELPDGNSSTPNSTHFSSSLTSPSQGALPVAEQSGAAQAREALLDSSIHPASSAGTTPPNDAAIVAQASHDRSDAAGEAMYADPASHSGMDAQPSQGMHAEAGPTEEADTADADADDMVADGMPDALESLAVASTEGHAPQMAVLASLDQVTINYLLQWHVTWAVTADSISEPSMRWLYALMAQVEKPITLESSSQLSKLLRHCVGMRTTITNDNDSRLLSVHMLIALAGGYFGQDGTLASCMQSEWV